MERGSGILLHITSLPSAGGIGDLGPSSFRFADRLAESGQRYWQMLPFNPPNPDNAESPYFSSSAFAGNPLLISLERLVDEGFLDRSDLPSWNDLPPQSVDYDAVRDRKMGALERAFAKFGGSSEYNRFCEQEAGWLDDFALFTALKRKFKNASWSSWPEELKRRDPAALDGARREFAESIARKKFYQFLFFSQWSALRAHCHARGVRLIGDIPIYVSFESADVWANPHLFKLDGDLRPVAVSGVPPDYFSATGQLWNNPVYNWAAVQKEGFAWWVSRMREVLERFDIVRIDHFRGLVQYWEVPAGSPNAITGSWQDVPTDALFAALIGQLPQFPVIAEDLGIITDDVRAAMARFGFPGMRVLQFAFGDSGGRNPHLPHNYDHNAVVYTGTHDNMTLRAWVEHGATADELRSLYRYCGRELAPEAMVRELIRMAMASVADVAIIPLADWLHLDNSARMNDPSKNEGNWRWRCTPEQMDAVPFATIREWSEMYQRLRA